MPCDTITSPARPAAISTVNDECRIGRMSLHELQYIDIGSASVRPRCREDSAPGAVVPKIMFATLLSSSRLSLLAALLALGSVAHAQTTPAPQTPREPQTESRTPEVTEGSKPLPPVQPGVAAPVDPKSYQIGAGDVLSVKVWKEADISGVYQVRPDGKITLPLVGDVQAGDLTPLQLTESLTKALSEYINKPEVTVSIQQVLSKKFYITGEINRPGAYALVVPITVMEALSNSGGFREFANKKKIVIMRGTQRIKFNYNDVIKGKNLDTNIFLQDGDHIYVPD